MVVRKRLKLREDYPDVTQTGGEQRCWEHGADTLSEHGAVVIFPFVKKKTKHSYLKRSKARRACMDMSVRAEHVSTLHSSIMAHEHTQNPVTRFAVVQSLRRVTLCDPTDCSTPGLLVLHHLQEFTYIHVD